MLRRRGGSDGNGKWLAWPREPATTAPASAGLLALGTEIAGETALAAWFRAALLGQGFGLAIAKYAQMWAATTIHPVAFLGALVLIILQNGFTLQGIDADAFNVVLGVAILVAMILNVYAARLRGAGRV